MTRTRRDQPAPRRVFYNWDEAERDLMGFAHEGHRKRFEAGIGFDWELLPELVTKLDPSIEYGPVLCFWREKHSHRGIGQLKGLRTLHANAVNASFLEEIVELKELETLRMTRVTASDLSPLRELPNLKRLVIDGGTKVPDLSWVPELPSIQALALENFKFVSDLEPLGELTALTALAVEGSMWTAMRVQTLAPIAELKALRSLFLTNTRVDDRSLRPLYELRQLRELQCAKFFSDEEFRGLCRAQPNLVCSWFERSDP